MQVGQDLEPALESYVPKRQEALQSYPISIEFMSRGCVIKVGCKSIPFSDTDEAISALNYYFNNPYSAQNEWRKQLI